MKLTSGDGQAIFASPAAISLTNGSATVNVTLDTADTTTLIATAGTITGVGNITVSPAAASSLAVDAPSTAIASDGFTVAITAKDPYGNTATNPIGAVTLTSSGGQTVFDSPSSIHLISGKATATVSLLTPDTLKLTATSGSLTGVGGSIAVSPAVASFAVGAPATATAGTGITVTITAKDAAGNLVSGYNGPVTLTSSDGQAVTVAPGSITLSGGIATVTATLNLVNTVTLTAGAGSIQGVSGAITVSPAAATSIAVSAPTSAAAGVGFSVTLTAKDRFGNTATNFSGPLTLTSSDGQAVTVSPTAPRWANGSTSPTVTLNNPGSLTLTASSGSLGGGSGNVVIESTASQAISSGLAALVNWGASQSFPLVGTATAIQGALQVGLVNPINAYLAQNAPTSPGFLTVLRGLSGRVGNLTITVAPGSVQEAVNGNVVTFSLDFQATQTTATSLGSLGTQADSLGIRLDPATQVNVTTSLNFNFSFGVNQSPGLAAAQAFFLSIPAGGFQAGVSINATNVNSGIDIGFLGAQASNGSIQLNAQAANAAAAVNVHIGNLQNVTLGLSTNSSLNIVLPLQAHLGTQAANGTVTIGAANLSNGASPLVQFQGFAGWQDFTTVGPDAVMSMLNQLASQFGQIGRQVWTTGLPFLGNLTLAQLANLEKAFQAGVTNQISAWSATLNRTVTRFTTAQDLAYLLTQVLGVDPNVAFDPTTNALTYNLAFTAYTFSSLLPPALQVTLNGGGLANASLGGSQLGLVPKVAVNLTLGVDLSPLGHGFVLTPTTTLTSLNAGAGVRINGTSAADLVVSLSDGSSFQVSLNGARTIQDAINVIQAATGGKVQVTIDPNNPATLDVSQPIATPIALNFASPATNLTPTTTLASLNGNVGVRTIGGGGGDLHVTLTDGTGFDVSLGNAATIQDVMRAIQQATGGKVQVTINPATRANLLVSQVAPAIAGQTGVLAITGINGSLAATDLGIQHLQVAAASNSYAAGDLGILGVDVAAIGKVTGLPTYGDSLDRHFFIKNATIQASVDGTVGQANGTIDLGAVALQMSNGSGGFHAQGSMTLQDPTTFKQLADALKGSTLLSLVSPQVSGAAHLDLPLALAVPLPGVTLPANAEIAVRWTDITDPTKLTVAVTPALNLANLTIAPVIQGLANLRTFVESQASTWLHQQIPGIGHSLADLVDPAASLTAAINDLTLNPPLTIDALAGRLGTWLGQAVSVSFTNGVLQLNLAYGFQSVQNVTLGFNLSPSLGSLVGANGSVPLSLSVNGSVKLGLVIDLTQPATPQFSVQDSGKIAVGAMINATGVAFSASVGPLGLSISRGIVQLDNGTPGQAATWIIGLNPSAANHLWSLGNVASQVVGAIHGRVNIDLPTFFPTPDQPLDPSKPDIKLIVADLGNTASTTTTVLPDFTTALGSVNLNGIMNQMVNGWDGVVRMLETALSNRINAQKIPVVGGQLQQALDFLHQLDSKVTILLQNAPQIAATTMQDALFQALGPQGLNWLVNITGVAHPTEPDYVQLQQSSGAIHYNIKLHEDLFALSSSIGANLGLDGLGLAVNGGVTLNAGFDATLGFGLSQGAGFYLDSSDTVGVNFNAKLNPGSNITGSLGFLQVQVTPTSSMVSGGLSLVLNDVHGTGRLSPADLTATSAFTIGMVASADIRLHLDASLGGNLNLPHVSTDFYFTWNATPTASNPDTVGFSNVTLDLGGFIDGIAAKIGQIMAPIKPLADVLTAPLPVLSQLIGHKVDMVDLAAALGFVSPGTADFLNAVAEFLSGNSLAVPTIDLGSFTLDPAAASDASSLGRLDPSTTNITSSYAGSAIPGFQIPILSNPASAFQFLLGKDVPLVTYETPVLGLNFAFSEFFPIIGPLGADLAGQIGASAQFGFGFDTSGFRQFAADNYRDPSLILDGFYVSDRANPDGTGPIAPQVTLYGSIAAYAAVDLGIVQAGIGGGLFASVSFTIHDPSGTGKVHVQDLVADIKKGTIFDASGAFKAFLAAYVEIDLLFVHKRWDFQIASVTLATIGEPAPSTPPVPQLATEDASGVLRLNVGAYAPQRLYVNTADGNETYTVTPGPRPGSVYVSDPGLGVVNQEYDNVTKVVADGVAGNDNITVNVDSSIGVDLAAGRGTNTFVVQNAGNVTLTGGAGNDTLEVDNATSANLNGGPGIEVLKVTGSGPATLRAGDGTDTLYAGGGAGQLLYGGHGTNLLVAGSGANQILHGGSGTSTLVGGGGAGQQLFGDDGLANLFGGTGSNQVLNAGTGDDHLYAGEADGQVLWGGGGNDVLQVGWQPQVAGQPLGFGNMPLGAVDNTTGRPLQVGWHLQESLGFNGWTVTNYTPGDANQGAGHGYEMHAGSGNTLVIGGWGDDTLYGGSGNDTLYGGGGNGNKVLKAGTGATQMYGGGPGNNLSPSTGNHTLFGGSGNDTLYGGDGINIVVNASRTGLINPAGDNGDDGINVLAAGSGNTTLYGDSIGANQNTLIGGSGRDTLFAGGTSGDYLEAGSGVTSLYGGSGSDVFQLPFIPAGLQANTPDTMVGGLGLTTLVLKPVQTVMVNDQLAQVSLTTDSDISFTGVAGTTNQYQATLRDLATGTLIGQVQFFLPASVQRVALLGGLGDNQIAVDPSVHRGMFLYGGTGHNILIAGSGNDVLLGGSGTSILQGGRGDDVQYGGAIPAIYQNLINNLGSGPGGSGSGGAATPNVLMTWLRQQPTGHNILIAGSGNSQLYAGNGGDLLIGGNAHFNAQAGHFVLDQGAGRDILQGGNGNDLMIGGLGGAGDAMIAGAGNSVLIGGAGQDILEGGGGNDVLIGGSLINVMMSNSANTATSYLLGGTGLNFEFGGAGNDQLFDYSNPNDPLQANAWSRVQALAALDHVALPPAAPSAGLNPAQAYQDLLYTQNLLSAQLANLNALSLHPTQYGTITGGSTTISNLYFMKQIGTTTGRSNVVTGLTTSSLFNGELVGGPGIPAGTTLNIPVDAQGNPIPGEIILSNVVNSAGTNQVALTFSDPIGASPTWETGNLTNGSNRISGLAQQISLAGYTTLGSATITHLASTASLAVGDTVTGAGIPTGSTIAQILDNTSMVLSQAATATSTRPVLLSFSIPLVVGEPVTGAGIPAGTTIASIVSGTSITLSNNATLGANGVTLCFGSLPFSGPMVTATGGIPAGDSVVSVITGTSAMLSQAATQTATNVTLTFSLTPQEEQQRSALNNLLASIAGAEQNALRKLGSTTQVDFLQGGSGTDALYAGANPAWMIGNKGSDTFYITPANYTYFANNQDTIQGGASANDTLMFLGDGNIHLSNSADQITDFVTINGQVLPWVEGHNISTLGVQTMGGNDTVTIDSPAFGVVTKLIKVIDGGNANAAGNVLIDATAFHAQGMLLGGAGNDTIRIGLLAFGSLVEGGTGNHQHNELDILGDNGGAEVKQLINTATNLEDIQVGAVWVTGSNFQKLVVTGGSGLNTFITDGNLIANVVLEGGTGTNTMSAQGGISTLIGGTGTNNMNVSGGTSTLIGGVGTNNMSVTGGTSTLLGGLATNNVSLNGAGNYFVIGGDGTNNLMATGGTSTLIGGKGQNNFTLVGAGTYSVTGGAGNNALTIQCVNGGDAIHLAQNASTITITGVMSATASNMNSVVVNGSLAGNNTLDASQMITGVSLIGVGPGNILHGGAGNDILDGGPGGFDSLTAGNDNDRLYVSGSYSTYSGTGYNSLVYRAQPNDNIAVYGYGLLVNGQLVFGSTTSYLTGTYIPFAGITSIGTIEIEDGTGTATAHAAQWSELPGVLAYSGGYSSTTSVLATVNYSGNGAYTQYASAYWGVNATNLWWNGNYTYYDPQPSFSYQWSFYSPGGSLTIIMSGAAGLVNLTGQVTGNVWDPYLNPYWDNSSGYYAYGEWFGGLLVHPGINVTNLTAVATGANAAVVHYPATFTTGGANPTTSGVTYSIASGSAFPVGTTAVTATATDGSGRQSTSIFDVTVLPATPLLGAPASSTPVSAQDVANADQFAASIGQFVSQAAASKVTVFNRSPVPIIQQISSLDALAQQEAESLVASSAFTQGAQTFLNSVVAGGLISSPFVQQQVVALNKMVSGGLAGSPSALGLLGFLNNVYFGGLTAPPFAGSSVTGAQVTTNGTVWFTCANGSLGSSSLGQAAVAITLNQVPVQVASLVIGSDGTAWFVTTGGQLGYCLVGQTAATPDQVARFVLSVRNTVGGKSVRVTVTAVDTAGNVILDYPGKVHFSSTDPQAGLPADYTFSAADAGSHTFSVALKTAGSQTITVSAGLASGQATVRVSAPAPRGPIGSAPTPPLAPVAVNNTASETSANSPRTTPGVRRLRSATALSNAFWGAAS